jgi:hypothetical protein
MILLCDATHPFNREWGANHLATADWKNTPAVVPALLKAAREDPVAGVRAACVRSLGKMNVCTTEVATTMQALRTDKDPYVRQEAERVLAGFPLKGKLAQPMPVIQAIFKGRP